MCDLSSIILADALRFNDPKEDEEALRRRRLSDDPTDLIVPTRDLMLLDLAGNQNSISARGEESAMKVHSTHKAH
jgi:hypothetical protein